MNQVPVRFEVKLIFWISCLFVLAMWVYQGSTDNAFVWDSRHYLLNYESHFSSLNWENIKWMATSLNDDNWHPLTWFSWAIDYQLYGWLDPWGFHFSNNLLHAINGGLVFVLMLTTLAFVYPVSGKFLLINDNRSLLAAFLAAALFVVHPQHVESVAWVAERKDLLCQAFLLLSLLAYGRYVSCNVGVNKSWYVATLSLYFLAVLSKPMAVTFPVVLLLLDAYPLRRTSLVPPIIGSVRQRSLLNLVVEKIPFFLLSFILVMLTLAAQKSAIATISDTSLAARVVNAVHSVVFYLEKFVFPFSLSPHYPYFPAQGHDSFVNVLLVFTIFIGVTLAAVMAWPKQKRAWVIAWLFYLVSLSPVLGLIQVGTQGAADRYAYFPTLPIYVLLAGGIYWLLKRDAPLGKALLLLVSVGVIFVFAFQTRQQTGIWKNELSLWKHEVKAYPDYGYARDKLGITFFNMGDFENAAKQFEASGKQASFAISMLAWRGLTYMHLGRYKESIMDHIKLGTASETRPEAGIDSDCIQYNIGWNYAQLGMFQEALELFERVDAGSRPGRDASLWASALKKVGGGDSKGVPTENLPGFCGRVIPSRMH